MIWIILWVIVAFVLVTFMRGAAKANEKYDEITRRALEKKTIS